MPTLKKKQLEDEENYGGFNEEIKCSNSNEKRKRSRLGTVYCKVLNLV